jgi:multiple sugar transport system ATP-binding protein
MRGEIKRLQHRLNTTTLYVTHDQAEAMTMADLVAVMRDGVLQQLAPPAEVYERPANRFVATFVGSPPMNVLPVGLDADTRALVVAGTPHAVDERRFAACVAAEVVEVGVRPEDARIVDPASPNALGGEVYVVEPMGNETLVEVMVGDARVTVRAPRSFEARIGTAVGVALDGGATCLFDREGTTAVHRAGRRPGESPVGAGVGAFPAATEEERG